MARTANLRAVSPGARLVLLLFVALTVPSSVRAQFPEGRDSRVMIWRSTEGRYGRPIHPGLPEVRAGFTFCRLWYDADRRMQSGLGWSTDYPAADGNFLSRLEELTPIRIARWENGDPGIAGLRATDDELMECPFLFMTDPGSVDFSDSEIAGLREYLMRGGFLWADDMWGNYAWSNFERQMTKILPEYAIQELTPDHPLFTVLYSVPEVPQIPSWQSWSRSGGRTSEFGAETETPHLRAIFDEEGRLLVLVSFNTDIGDGFEREGDRPDFFYLFSPKAYGLAINIMIWAMSH
jgi:hypothetical protein